jgi:hypothetical protein
MLIEGEEQSSSRQQTMGFLGKIKKTDLAESKDKIKSLLELLRSDN